MLLYSIIDETATLCCQSERLFLAHLEGDCLTPLGGWARIENDKFLITGYSASLDGRRNLTETLQGATLDAEKIALNLADVMIKKGCREFIAK